MNSILSFVLILLLFFFPNGTKAQSSENLFVRKDEPFPIKNVEKSDQNSYVRGRVPYADWLIKRCQQVRESFLSVISELRRNKEVKTEKDQIEINWVFVKANKKLDYIGFLDNKFKEIIGKTMDEAGYNYGLASIKEEIEFLKKEESLKKKPLLEHQKIKTPSLMSEKKSPSLSEDSNNENFDLNKVIEKDNQKEVVEKKHGQDLKLDDLGGGTLSRRVSCYLMNLKAFISEKMNMITSHFYKNEKVKTTEVKMGETPMSESASLNKSEASPSPSPIAVNKEKNDSSKKMELLEHENSILMAQLSAKESEKNKSHEEISSLKKKITRKDSEIRACSVKNNNVELTVKSLKKDLEAKEKKIGELENKLYEVIKRIDESEDRVPPTAPAPVPSTEPSPTASERPALSKEEPTVSVETKKKEEKSLFEDEFNLSINKFYYNFGCIIYRALLSYMYTSVGEYLQEHFVLQAPGSFLPFW